MPTITLRAHYDGKQIKLDEPYNLQPNTSLLITIVPIAQDDRHDWLGLSTQGLGNAYCEDEPNYSLNMIKEPNPNYEAG
ncbi:MAG: hypothetical protein R6X34_05775 [Chloroflexota bacterium]